MVEPAVTTQVGDHMRTMYRLMHWPPGQPFQELGLHPSALDAMDTAE